MEAVEEHCQPLTYTEVRYLAIWVTWIPRLWLVVCLFFVYVGSFRSNMPPKEWKNKDGSLLKKKCGCVLLNVSYSCDLCIAYTNIYIYTYYSNLPLQPLPYGHLHGVQGTKGVRASALGLMISHHLVQLLLRMVWCDVLWHHRKSKLKHQTKGWICKLHIHIYFLICTSICSQVIVEM